ncbi:MAG: MBOAT family O-acyltransferase [Roseburia sp.]
MTRWKAYKRIFLSGGIIAVAGCLVAFKFSAFVRYTWFIPIAISFYSLQAIGYLIDLYREDIKFEKNFVIYALFLSFFPYAVSGPIERAGNMFRQFREVHKFDYERVCHGVQLFLWGHAVKLILADRLGMIARELLSNPMKYSGWEMIVGIMAYTLYIYCDFSSYSDMARGVAKILGFDIMCNFARPYFAKSISEFWRRWHISLSSWLRDYVYISLGGNKGGSRKYFNLFVVFLISGLWHGTGWNFILWGMVYVVYYIGSEVTRGARQNWKTWLCIKPNSWEDNCIRRSVTFLLVAFAWIFFFGSSVGDAFAIIASMFRENNIGVLFHVGRFNIGGMTSKDWIVIYLALAVLLLIDIMRERKINIYQIVDRQTVVVRWGIYLGMLTAIIIFGIYGPAYGASAFIYQAF